MLLTITFSQVYDEVDGSPISNVVKHSGMTALQVLMFSNCLFQNIYISIARRTSPLSLTY
jgi:hypothetical protein